MKFIEVPSFSEGKITVNLSHIVTFEAVKGHPDRSVLTLTNGRTIVVDLPYDKAKSDLNKQAT